MGSTMKELLHRTRGSLTMEKALDQHLVCSAGFRPLGKHSRRWRPTEPPTACGAMEDIDRQRTLEYFERLGKKRVRLYTAIDCERFLGGWQVRELADQWLAVKDAEDGSKTPLWRRFRERRRSSP